jgi:hypothetical protein
MTAPLAVHLKWVGALEEEFFRQGDVELETGLPISPLFDRRKAGITKAQAGFFEVVVIPTFHAFAQVYPDAQPLLVQVLKNHKYWLGEQRTVCLP